MNGFTVEWFQRPRDRSCLTQQAADLAGVFTEVRGRAGSPDFCLTLGRLFDHPGMLEIGRFATWTAQARARIPRDQMPDVFAQAYLDLWARFTRAGQRVCTAESPFLGFREEACGACGCRGWLFTLWLNACHSAWRRRSSRPLPCRSGWLEARPSCQDALHEVEDHDERARVLELVQTWQDEPLRAVMLAAFAGERTGAIAARMSLRASRVSQLKFQGARQLRQQLGLAPAR